MSLSHKEGTKTILALINFVYIRYNCNKSLILRETKSKEIITRDI